MSDQDRVAVGIDLGTTFSVVAYVDETDKVVTLQTEDGNAKLPSVVCEPETGLILVGQLAKEHWPVAPEKTALHVKRSMGTEDTITVAGKSYRPEEISARILRCLKDQAERRIGRAVTDAVITVPAYFDAKRVQATQDAGEIAGLNVLHILREPTAAAIAYGMDNPKADETVLVYDLGGGTFDITLLKICPSNETSSGLDVASRSDRGTPTIRVVSVEGNPQLGGLDWDEAIAAYAAEEYLSQHGQDPRAVPGHKAYLFDKAMKMKEQLAQLKANEIPVQGPAGLIGVPLSREKLYELTQGLLQITVAEIEKLLKETGVAKSEIDTVLAVGGSTRLVMVREMLESMFPGRVQTDVDPDQCVAWGAARMARWLIDKGGVPVPLPVDVCPKALGVDALNSNDELRIFPLIPKDTPLPATGERLFATPAEGMTQVKFGVFQNEARSRDDVWELDTGETIGDPVVISGLPPGRPKGQQIKVLFEFDESFRLQVRAWDVSTGNEVRAEIRVSGMEAKLKEEATSRLKSAEIQG